MSINKGALKAFVCGAGVAFFHMAITAYFSRKKGGKMYGTDGDATVMEFPIEEDEVETQIADVPVEDGRSNPEPVFSPIVNQEDRVYSKNPAYELIDGDQVGEDDREIVTLYYYIWDDVLLENDEEEVSDLLAPLKDFIKQRIISDGDVEKLVYHVRHPFVAIDYEVIPINSSWHEIFAGGDK